MPLKKWLSCMLCAAAVLASAAVFAQRVSAEFQKIYPWDMVIFTDAGVAFWQTGRLYPRGDDLADLYKPGAPVFKFPPPYQLLMAPWLTDGIPAHFYLGVRVFMLLLYALAVAWITARVLRHMAPAAGPCSRRTALVAFVAIHALLSTPFINAFGLLTAEIPILFLLVATIALLDRYPALAGTALAMAATAKVYPAFMAVAACLAQRPWRFLAGLAAGGVLFAGLGLAVFGLEENRFYLTRVLPLLLQEPLTPHAHNIGWAFFLVQHGIPLHTAATLAKILPGLMLAAALAAGVRARQRAPQQRLAAQAFMLVAMLLCLRNYWLQYHLLLLVPTIVIAGHLLERRRWLAFGLFVLVLLSLNMDPSWYVLLVQHSVALDSLDQATVLRQLQEDGLSATLYRYSFSGWLAYWYTECRALVPWVLGCILAGMLWRTPPLRPGPVHPGTA